MGIKADIDLLRARFETRWQALHPAIRYLLDNDVEPRPPIAPDETFVRFTVKPDRLSAASLGQMSITQTGLFLAQICAPAQSGAVAATALADDVLSMFQGWRSTDNSLLIKSFDIQTRQPRSDDPWFLVTVSGEYESNRPA